MSYEFQCGSPVCNSHFSANSKDRLMEDVAEHVRTAHNIPVPTKSILGYLEATAVTRKGGPDPAEAKG